MAVNDIITPVDYNTLRASIIPAKVAPMNLSIFIVICFPRRNSNAMPRLRPQDFFYENVSHPVPFVHFDLRR